MNNATELSTLKVIEVFGVACDYCGDMFFVSEMVRCHAECETLFCATHGEKYLGTAVPAVRS